MATRRAEKARELGALEERRNALFQQPDGNDSDDSNDSDYETSSDDESDEDESSDEEDDEKGDDKKDAPFVQGGFVEDLTAAVGAEYSLRLTATRCRDFDSILVDRVEYLRTEQLRVALAHALALRPLGRL